MVYKVSNNVYVQENNTNTILLYMLIAILAIEIILMIYLVIKYKSKGIWAVLSNCGFIALYLLMIRYTNVSVSIASIVALFIILLLNVDLCRNLISDTEKYNKQFISFLIKMIPIYVISIIFSFINWALLNTFGMTLFWGITLMFIYNIIITKRLVKAD